MIRFRMPIFPPEISRKWCCVLLIPFYQTAHDFNLSYDWWYEPSPLTKVMAAKLFHQKITFLPFIINKYFEVRYFAAIKSLMKLLHFSSSVHWCFLAELINAIMVAIWWVLNSITFTMFISCHSIVKKNFSSLVYLYQDGLMTSYFIH